MHRLFLLRAYGDFVILLQALLESPQKNKYSLIASKHLEPLYQELALVIDLSSIQIQFINFGITNTQLSLFTNKHILSLNTLKELKQIKTVKITTASAINDAIKQQLATKIAAGFEGKTVELETAMNADLIGGFVIEMDDKLYDASIRKELNDIKNQFTNNSYISKI